MKYQNISLLVVFILALLIREPVQAGGFTFLGDIYSPLGELRSKNFAIIYPMDSEDVAKSLFSLYSVTLDNEYDLFAKFFKTSLPLPISIRIYQNTDDYNALNAGAASILSDATHTHVGYREIALIGNNIAANIYQWQTTALNAFRFELAELFVEQITGGKTSPGLLSGVGFYAQNPVETVGQSLPSSDIPANRFWEGIWSNTPSTQMDIIQSVSIVAFLVDDYSWPTFLKYIQGLRTAENYKVALMDTYQHDIDYLSAEWRTYYSFYIHGRWKAHALYNYDFSVSEKLLAAGDFSDSIQTLQDALAFLTPLNQADKINTAQDLLNMAKAGQGAENLLVQARQALQDGKYEQAISLVNQSRQEFKQISDTHHQNELDTFEQRAQQILSLRSQLADLQKSLTNDPLNQTFANQLMEISLKLGKLGDLTGQENARQASQQIINSRDNNHNNDLMKTIIKIVILMIALLGLRLWMMRLKPSKEARL